jgi:protein-S-isoprenylcysteine O-methyltransferase Ste14
VNATTPSLGRLVFAVVYVAFFPALILFLSGDWRWTEGWVFAAWFLTLCYTTAAYAYRRDPGLFVERYRTSAPNQKGWDVYVVAGMRILALAWFVVMPLDARRYGWSGEFPVWLKVLGGVALLASSFFLFRSYTDNTFLSPLVRVQSERKHHVVSTGVYGFVRHPMYLGAVLMFAGTPLLLGTLWGVGIGVVMMLLLAGRIFGEEKMLTEELEGYADYKQRVRYRLIPFVW